MLRPSLPGLAGRTVRLKDLIGAASYHRDGGEVATGTDRDDVIAVETRSAMQILNELSAFCERARRAYARAQGVSASPAGPGGTDALPPLMRISSGMFRPTAVFAAVRDGDLWYRIDDGDLVSKGGAHVPLDSHDVGRHRRESPGTGADDPDQLMSEGR